MGYLAIMDLGNCEVFLFYYLPRSVLSKEFVRGLSMLTILKTVSDSSIPQTIAKLIDTKEAFNQF